jgi:adenylate cyclase
MLKKIALSPWTALITLLLILSVRVADPSFVESVRLRYFDTLITKATPTENEIYVVNIDESALDKWGQFPFPRSVYAEIIQELYKRNAGLVVWNVMMPEADRFGGDAALAKVLADNPTILTNVPSNKDKNVARKPGIVVLGPEYKDRIVNYGGMIANIPELENNAVGIGSIYTMPELDGVTRRMPLVISRRDQIFPSLGMEVLRVAAGDTTTQVKLNENGVEKMRIPKFGPISTDELGRIWIDWAQRSKSVSVTNLPEDFANAVVVVGVSAAGIGNPVATAKGSVWPQDVQAAVINTLLNQVNIQRPDYANGVERLAILTAGLILLFLTRWVYVGLGSVVVMAGAGIYGSIYAFDHYLLLLDATAFTVAVVLVSLHAYGVKFVSEFLQKQQIKKQFGTYLSPALVEKLQKNPELLRLGGETRELSIMFTDVRGFTTISEHYGADVQGLTQIMNRYMTAMTAKILDNEGTLDKYIGDAQMAFWNAPLDDTDHAKHAVKTALEMLDDLAEFNRQVQAEGIPPFGMGLGINTGDVVVGNMGSSQRFDYTCLGDAVNLASRLEGQSKPYHVKLIIGPKTYEYVKNDYVCVELDCLAVKGKHEGVNIYTIVPPGSVKPPALTTHQYFLDYYRSCRWDEAISYANILKKAFDGELADYYDAMIERIEEYKINSPGENWDGVFRTNSK